MKTNTGHFLAATLVVLGGCGALADDVDPTVDEAAGALGGPGCSDGGFDASIAATIGNPLQRHFTPRTYSYSGCFKAYLVNVRPAVRDQPTKTFHVVAGWNDTPPTTAETCEAAMVRVYAYDGPGSTPQVVTDRGTWESGFCRGPEVDFVTAEFRTLRLAMTARTANTSQAPTRALRYSVSTPPAPTYFSPGAIDFGRVNPGTKVTRTVTFTNILAQTAVPTVPSPLSSSLLSISDDRCTGVRLPPQGTCTFKVSFDLPRTPQPSMGGVNVRQSVIWVTNDLGLEYPLYTRAELVSLLELTPTFWDASDVIADGNITTGRTKSFTLHNPTDLNVSGILFSHVEGLAPRVRFLFRAIPGNGGGNIPIETHVPVCGNLAPRTSCTFTLEMFSDSGARGGFSTNLIFRSSLAGVTALPFSGVLVDPAP